jgi:hypothetical protein
MEKIQGLVVSSITGCSVPAAGECSQMVVMMKALRQLDPLLPLATTLTLLHVFDGGSLQ